MDSNLSGISAVQIAIPWKEICDLSLQVAMRIIDLCVTVIAQSSNLFIWAKKTGTSATIQSETFREKTLKNQYFKDMHLIFLFVRPLAGM